MTYEIKSFDKWITLIDESWNNIKNIYHDRWKQNIENYSKFLVTSSQAEEYENSSLFMEGKARTSLVFSTIRTMIPKLATGDAWVKVQPDSPNDARINWEVYELALNKAIKIVDGGYHIKKVQLDALLCGVGWIRIYAPEFDDVQFPENSLVNKLEENPLGTFINTDPLFEEITKEEAKMAESAAGQEISFGLIPEELISKGSSYDYRERLPTFRRISPFHIIFPKYCTSIENAAWIAHIIPTTMQDLYDDKRYKNSNLKKLEDIKSDSDFKVGTELKGTFERSRGEYILFKVEVWVKSDPFRSGKENLSNKVFHYIIGHDEPIFITDNPFKDKVIPMFDLQFNRLNDKPVGVSEVDAMSYDVGRVAAVESAMAKHFTANQKSTLFIGSGATIAEDEMQKYLNDVHGHIIKVEGDARQVVPAPHIPSPPDWLIYRNLLKSNIFEDVGLDSFQRGAAVKDISASQATIIDKSAQARIEEKISEIQMLFKRFMPMYSELLVSFVDQIFVDIKDQTETINLNDYKDITFIYSIDPMSLKPTASLDEAIKYIQFLKVIGSMPPFLFRALNWERILKHIVHSMGLSSDTVMPNSIIKQAIDEFMMLQQVQALGPQQNNRTTVPGDRAETMGEPGNNSNPLADLLSSSSRGIM